MYDVQITLVLQFFKSIGRNFFNWVNKILLWIPLTRSLIPLKYPVVIIYRDIFNQVFKHLVSNLKVFPAHSCHIGYRDKKFKISDILHKSYDTMDMKSYFVANSYLLQCVCTSYRIVIVSKLRFSRLIGKFKENELI